MPTVDPNIEAEIRRGKLEQQRKLQRMTMARLPAGVERDAAASQFQSLGSELGVIGRVQNRENVAARGPVGAEEAAVRHARIKEQAISARAFTRSDQNVQLLERGGLGDTDAARGQAELGIDSLKKFNDQSRAPLPQPFDGGPSFEDRSRSRQVAEADLRRRRAAGSDAVQEQRAQLPDQRGRELDTSRFDSELKATNAVGDEATFVADRLRIENDAKIEEIKQAVLNGEITRQEGLSRINATDAGTGKTTAERQQIDIQNEALRLQLPTDSRSSKTDVIEAADEAAFRVGLGGAENLFGTTDKGGIVQSAASRFTRLSGFSGMKPIGNTSEVRSLKTEIQQIEDIAAQPGGAETAMLAARQIVQMVRAKEGNKPAFGFAVLGFGMLAGQAFEDASDLWDRLLRIADLQNRSRTIDTTEDTSGRDTRTDSITRSQIDRASKVGSGTLR